MNSISEVLTPAIVLGIIAYVIQIVLEHRQKMKLIEKGQDMPKFDIGKTRQSSSGLKWGLFAIGIAIGFMAGNVLEYSTHLDREVSYFSMIFLFGGAALVLYHFIEKNRSEN